MIQKRKTIYKDQMDQNVIVFKQIKIVFLGYKS